VTSPLKDRHALIAKVTEYLIVKPWLTAAGVYELIQNMRDQDFSLERLANFWGRPDFKGITSVWRSADGKLFEQQFHVAESRHARDFTFGMYDRMRQAETRPEERAEIRALIRDVMAAVPVPPGAAGIPPFPPSAAPARPETPPPVGVAWHAATDLLAAGDHSPRAILRRTITENGELDEALGRDDRVGQMRWLPTSLLYSAERGDLAHWFSLVSQADAATFTQDLRRTHEVPPQ
jgi:hypothetical protein